MFRRRGVVREWLSEVVEKFREEGAVSPDRAMTAQELGLPPGFQEAMKRRLGRSGIFVEVNGRYYLSEERLKEIGGLGYREGGMRGSRKRMVTLRMVQMITTVLFVTLLLVNLFVQSWEIRVISSVFMVAWLVISVLQIYYLSRARRRMSPSP